MLKKLSLAAIVAMGSMSIASASTDLSEAIQGVTLGGFLRYRYTESNTKNHKADGSDNANKTLNEYKAVVNTNIKATDEVSIHNRFVYVNKFYSNNSDSNTEAPKPFNVREAYINYSANGLNVHAGLQALATPLSDHDDDYANAVLATYTINAVTLAGAYANEVSKATGQATSQNMDVLGLIANVAPAKLQAWFYSLSDTNDNSKDGKYSAFVEAAANLGPVVVKAQYAQAKTDADNAKTQKFGALAVVSSVANVNVTAAYLNFGKNGSEVRAGLTNADALIAAGDILTDAIQQTGFSDGWGGALVLSTKVDKFTPGVQYVHATINDGKDVANEYDFDLAYQYSKKLKFSGYYAFLKENGKNLGNINKTQGRFEAKYSF